MRDDIVKLWTAFRADNPDAPIEPPAIFHFCDNEADADICADLVARGQKRATASSLAELEIAGESIPQSGDFAIVTKWSGKPVGVIRTTNVELRSFDEVDADFAAREGEGDLSLEWWREAHEAYYRRVLAGSSHSFSGDLMIACEDFELVLKA